MFVLNKLDIKIKIHFFVFYFDRYKTRGEFASDARLVFNNCMIFNEDESDVGKAGHSMRKVFETRWKELLLSSSDTSQPVTAVEDDHS